MAYIEDATAITGGAAVDINHNLKVTNPTSASQAGYVALAGVVDAARSVTIPISASTQGLLGTGQASIDWEEGFAASAISPSKWAQVLSTMTTSVSNNAVVLNAGSSLASGAVARLVSWRTAETPRGADRVIGWRAMVPNQVAGAVFECGMFTASGVTAPTGGAFFRYAADGTLRGVIISISGSENSTAVIPTPTLGVAHDYVIMIGKTSVIFQIDDAVVGFITLGDTSPSPVTSESGPFCARLYNSSATASAQLVYLYRSVGAYYGGNYGYTRPFLAALGGDVGSQGVVGGSTGSLANYANSAAPASATLSNTAAGYTTLGGQFQFAAVAGAETDYALFAFQVPAQTATNQGRTLLIHGVTIDTFNTVAAVAGTATVMQWAVGYDSSAVSLATADAAATKARRVVPIGVQSFAIGAAAGAQAVGLKADFTQPLPINAGNYFHVILKMPIGTATATEIFRGVVGIDATWE